MIAAAEKTRISVVAFEFFASDFARGFGLDDRVAALAIGAEDPTAGTLAGGGAAGRGGVAVTFSGGTMTVRTLTGGVVGGEMLLGPRSAVGTLMAGIGVGET